MFINLVETDMIWGHRNDPRGVRRLRWQEFDEELPRLLAALRHGDLLMLTSDHGCDPTTPSTDHSREHGLLLAHVRRVAGDGPPRTTATRSPTSARPCSRTSPAGTARELPGAPVVHRERAVSSI